jgi:hypothetical protein
MEAFDMAQNNMQTQDILKRIQGVLDQLGIELNLAIKVLIVAAVSGILAVLLDEILGLPSGALVFSFSWFIAVLNGPTYAFFKGKDDVPGVIMAGVAGLVTLFVWFIVMKIIGGDVKDIKTFAHHDLLTIWFDDINILKAMLTGIIVGLIGFGWFAGLRRLPAKFLP